MELADGMFSGIRRWNVQRPLNTTDCAGEMYNIPFTVEIGMATFSGGLSDVGRINFTSDESIIKKFKN